MRREWFFSYFTCLLFLLHLPSNVSAASVQVWRVPHGGIQPQVVADDQGRIHMVYFKGEASGGDLFYVTLVPGDTVFSKPIQVNTIPNSTIATGSVRGAHIALGRQGRVHVAWMSSAVANGGSHDQLPMFYTRLNDTKTAFEPQKDVIQHAFGLDGGGSVAADTLGNVYVAWHAGGDEANRRVWIAHSDNDGKTFDAEVPAWHEKTGACGCCGMRIFAEPSGDVFVMYRSATEMVHRDMYVLWSRDYGKHFDGVNAHPWQANGCPMSTVVIKSGQTKTLAAWETMGQVYFANLDNLSALNRIQPTEDLGKNKHPAVAQNKDEDVLLVWLVGAGWKKAGVVTYQVFDKFGQARENPKVLEKAPVWSRAAATALPNGDFVILY